MAALAFAVGTTMESAEISNREGLLSPSLTKPAVYRLRIQATTAATPQVATVNVELPQRDVYAWIKPSFESLFALSKLKDNWDSYGAKGIRQSVVSRAIKTLTTSMEPASPAPAVVPLSTGGIQLEWHRRQRDLEIIIEEDRPIRYYYEDNSSGEMREGAAGTLSDVAVLISLIK